MTELAGASGSGTGGAGLRSGGIDQPARSTSRCPQVVFAVTALGAFMASLDLSIVNVAFPALQRSFPHDSRATLAWVITAYTIVFASLLVTAGRTADRLGRRRIFFVGLGVFTLGSALCAAGPVGGLADRAGASSRGSGPPPWCRPRSVCCWGPFPSSGARRSWPSGAGVGALAVATGPSLGAALISVGGWRWAFFVNLPVGLVAWLVGRRVLVGVPGRRASRGPPRLRRRGPVGRGAGRPGAGHLRRTDLGLGERPRRGLLRGRARSWRRRLRVPLGAPSGTGAGPEPVLGPVVFRGERRRGALRHGLLRHAPRQRAVPDRGVALLAS